MLIEILKKYITKTSLALFKQHKMIHIFVLYITNKDLVCVSIYVMGSLAFIHNIKLN